METNQPQTPPEQASNFTSFCAARDGAPGVVLLVNPKTGEVENMSNLDPQALFLLLLNFTQVVGNTLGLGLQWVQKPNQQPRLVLPGTSVLPMPPRGGRRG